jgi:hypothetical protein
MSDPHSPHALLRICFDPVPVHLRPVLGALLSGATDAAASHQLNVSPRTFSRRLAELLEHFGAQTRFQAGVTFGLRGVRTPLRDHGGLLDVEGWPAAGVVNGSMRSGVEADLLRAVTVLPPVIGRAGDMLGGR